MIFENDVLPARREDFAATPEAPFAEVYEAARQSALYVGNADARHRSHLEAYNRRIADVFEATGVQLDNPLIVEPGTRRNARVRRGESVDATPIWEEREASFMERLGQLAVQFPDAAERIKAERGINEDARDIAKAAETRMGIAGESRGFWGALPGSLAGGFVGSLEDPYTIATAPIGWAAGGKTVLTQLIRGGIGAAAVNAGTTAAMQPAVQSWRKEAGLSYGLGEAASEVAWSAAFGFPLGVAGKGVELGVRRAAGLPAVRPEPPITAPARSFDDAAVAETVRVAKTVPAELMPDEGRAALRMLESQREAEALTPARIAVDDHLDALVAAERHVDDPENNAPPVAPERVREADGPAITDDAVANMRVVGDDPAFIEISNRAKANEQEQARLNRAANEAQDRGDLAERDRLFDQSDVLKEQRKAIEKEIDAFANRRTNTLNREITIGTKPARTAMVKASALQFDANTFQYKGGGDAQGVTDKLRSVQAWDQSSAGWLYVWERADGAQFVADGHQRTGLAQRLSRQQGNEIEIPSFVFREAEGWQPAEVRWRAAQKNIREGTGDVIDTATIIREKPSALDRSLPLGTDHIRNAIALSKLSDEAWGMLRAGVLPPHLARAIGEQAADAPVLHRGLAEALIRQDVATADQARMVVAQALRLGAKDAETKAQMSLFGDDFFAQTHIIEQAKVLDGALKKLSQDARLFALVRDKGEKLEAAGNVMVGDVNARTAELAKIAASIVERLARVDGPVADIMGELAVKVAKRELRVTQAADEAASRVIELFEREGLDGVMNRQPASPQPQPAPKPIEPGTPEAVEKAERAVIELWHGSPHDFERFDMQHIGAGEGAQSFGHGLYFAQNADVASIYKDRLARKKAAMGGAPDGQAEIRHEDGMWNVYVDGELENAFGAKADAEAFINKGALYKVRISADQADFLDWDKPISEQSSQVQSAIGELSTNKEVASRIQQLGKNATIGQIYGAVGRGVTHSTWRGHGAVGPEADAAATKAFRDAGIPGIKYLDQGSRDSGEGTRNFVVFDDKLVEIIEKNGKPVGGAKPQGEGVDLFAVERQEPSLFDMMPADGERERLVAVDELKAAADREDELAKMIGICNSGAARQGA